MTVQLGEIEDVLDTEFPVKDGDALLEVVDDPDDEPLSEATNSFCAYEEYGFCTVIVGVKVIVVLSVDKEFVPDS